MANSDRSGHVLAMLESKSGLSDSFTDLKVLDDIVDIVRGMPASDSQFYNKPTTTRLYPQACKFFRLDHHLHSSFEKSIIIERKNNPIHKR